VTVERRVIMLSRGGRLAPFAFQALGNGRSVACLESPVELADWTRPPVDVVLLDLPRHHRGIIYRQLRQRYRGPVLALLDPDDDGGGLPPDRGPLAILYRPFSGEELSDALGTLLAPPDQVRLPTLRAVDGGARRAAETAEAASGSPPGPPGPAGPPTASYLTAGAVPRRAWRSRWRSLARRRVRRWRIVAAMSSLLVLGLGFGTQGGCGSGCGSVAGAADGSSIGTLANSDVGLSLQPPTSGSTFTGSTVAPSSAVAAVSGPASGTSVIGGLISSGSPSLLDSTAGGGSIIGAALVGPAPPTLSPLSNATTTKPPTTKPPATTAAPTTAPPTTAAPTTAAPTTQPATTAAPTTAPPTTAAPTTEPPATTAAG